MRKFRQPKTIGLVVTLFLSSCQGGPTTQETIDSLKIKAQLVLTALEVAGTLSAEDAAKLRELVVLEKTDDAYTIVAALVRAGILSQQEGHGLVILLSILKAELVKQGAL